MKSYDGLTADKAVGFFVIVIIGVLFYGMYMAVHQHNQFRDECAAAGGVPFQPKDAAVCLKKDQIQPTRSDAH